MTILNLGVTIEVPQDRSCFSHPFAGTLTETALLVMLSITTMSIIGCAMAEAIGSGTQRTHHPAVGSGCFHLCGSVGTRPELVLASGRGARHSWLLAR